MRVNLIAAPVKTMLTYLLIYVSVHNYVDDVNRTIKNLPTNKAPGCDKVNAKILKLTSYCSHYN